MSTEAAGSWSALQNPLLQRAANSTKVHLHLGVGADIWHVEADGKEKKVASNALPGLSAANVDQGRLELRGALATHEIDVEAGRSVTVDFVGGKILVDH